MPKLDRLSALLEGLSPRVVLSDKPSGFAIYILIQDQMVTSPYSNIEALRILVCPPGNKPGEEFESTPPYWQVWMAFQVHFDGPVASLFLSEFAESVEIPVHKAEPSLAQIVQIIAQERMDPRCGQPLLMERAGDILLIGILRQLVAQPHQNSGLFSALAHPRIAQSIVAMHSNINKHWSLELLAEQASMSRTTFATQFKAIMKISPGKYLETLRLCTARKLIKEGKTLKYTASKTGYASPSTLARALARQNTIPDN